MVTWSRGRSGTRRASSTPTSMSGWRARSADSSIRGSLQSARCLPAGRRCLAETGRHRGHSHQPGRRRKVNLGQQRGYRDLDELGGQPFLPPAEAVLRPATRARSSPRSAARSRRARTCVSPPPVTPARWSASPTARKRCLPGPVQRPSGRLLDEWQTEVPASRFPQRRQAQPGSWLGSPLVQDPAPFGAQQEWRPKGPLLAPAPAAESPPILRRTLRAVVDEAS